MFRRTVRDVLDARFTLELDIPPEPDHPVGFAQADYLKSLGAGEVLGRDALATTRPMESARFGGGLDNVGGPMLASLLN